MTPIRIVIADDHPIVRSGLIGLLASQDDFDVVAEAADGQELVAAVQRTRPDVVLTDLRMPALDGVGAIREMCAAHSGLKVLVLTTYDTRRGTTALIRSCTQHHSQPIPRAISTSSSPTKTAISATRRG